MCQPMPTGRYICWEFHAVLHRFKPRSIKVRCFENMIKVFFQSSRAECEIEKFYTTGTQQIIDCFSVDGFCGHCSTVFEALRCFYHFCGCQEVQPGLTEEDNVRRNIKKELDELRQCHLGKNVHTQWWIVWLHLMWCTSSRELRRKVWSVSTGFQNALVSR